MIYTFLFDYLAFHVDIELLRSTRSRRVPVRFRDDRYDNNEVDTAVKTESIGDNPIRLVTLYSRCLPVCCAVGKRWPIVLDL